MSGNLHPRTGPNTQFDQVFFATKWWDDSSIVDILADDELVGSDIELAVTVTDVLGTELSIQTGVGVSIPTICSQALPPPDQIESRQHVPVGAVGVLSEHCGTACMYGECSRRPPMQGRLELRSPLCLAQGQTQVSRSKR